MSREDLLTNFSLLIVDKKTGRTGFCQDCNKQLKTYRQIRYHFKTFHELTAEQFEKISKLGRIFD